MPFTRWSCSGPHPAWPGQVVCSSGPRLVCHRLSVQITWDLHGHSNASCFSKCSPWSKSSDWAFPVSRKFKPILIGFFFCPGTAGIKQKVFAFNFFPKLHKLFLQGEPFKNIPWSISFYPSPHPLYILINFVSGEVKFDFDFPGCGNWFYFHLIILDLKDRRKCPRPLIQVLCCICSTLLVKELIDSSGCCVSLGTHVGDLITVFRWCSQGVCPGCSHLFEDLHGLLDKE